MSINQLPAVTREINSTRILEAITGLQAALTQANTLLTEVAGVTPVTNVTIDDSSGLATAELQGIGNTSLTTINGTLSTISGKVATTALQTTGNNSLSSIDGKLPAMVSSMIPVRLTGVVSANNTTATPLAGGATFTGTADDVRDHAAIIVSCKPDVASATKGLSLQFSMDGLAWTETDYYTVAAGSCKTYTLQPVARYFRVVYTNGAAPQAAFILCTQFRQVSVKPSSHRMGDDIGGEDDAELVKAVLAAEKPGGVYTNINCTTGGNLKFSLEEINGSVAGQETMANSVPVVIASDQSAVPVSLATTPLADGLTIDAFSRLRVSNPGYRFDAQLTYQINTDVWDKAEVSSGTVAHNSTLRAATLTAAAGIGSKAVLQSHYNCPYTPGRSQLAFITFLFGATPSAGVSRRAGYYDETEDAGIYLEQTSAAVNLVLKTGGTGYATQTVPQDDWNIDPLDGTGPSGLTLNLERVQILVIQLQALYVGRVVVAFDIGGEVVPVHAFAHANSIAYTYITQASLPVHYSIRTTAAAGGAMTAICASVISEGGESLENMPGRAFAASNGITSIGVTSRRPILSIRCRQQLNSLNQQSIIIPVACEVLARTNDAYVQIVRNGTLTNDTWAAGLVDSALSVVEYDIAADAITGGQIIEAFFVPASASTRSAAEKSIGGKSVLCYSHLLGVGDKLSVVVTSRTGTCDAHGALKWREIR